MTMIRVSKGGSQLSGCQIAQSRDSFCDFGTTEQNRPGFVQFDNQKFESHLLTPESDNRIKT